MRFGTWYHTKLLPNHKHYPTLKQHFWDKLSAQWFACSILHTTCLQKNTPVHVAFWTILQLVPQAALSCVRWVLCWNGTPDCPMVHLLTLSNFLSLHHFPWHPSLIYSYLLCSCTTSYIIQSTAHLTPQHYSHWAPLRWADFLLLFYYISFTFDTSFVSTAVYLLSIKIPPFNHNWMLCSTMHNCKSIPVGETLKWERKLTIVDNSHNESTLKMET